MNGPGADAPPMRFGDRPQVAGGGEVRPRGSLALPESRELLVVSGYFGAWRADGSRDIETLRRWNPEGATPDAVPEACPSRQVVRTVDEEVVWAGPMALHYGHFLIESVARLWPLLPGAELQGRPVVFPNDNGLAFAREWLDAFGVRAVSLPVEGAVNFANAYVPEPALRLGVWAALELRDVHLWARRHLSVERRPAGGVLWLSRTGLAPSRTVYDERLLEWILRDHLTVIRPETMTLGEQLAAIEASDVVAGILGSAFHTLLMAEEAPKRLVLCGGKVQSTYVMQEEMLGGEYLHLRALCRMSTSRLRGPRFPAGMRLLIPETIRALRKHAIPDLAEDPQVARLVERVQRAPPSGGRADGDLMEAVAGAIREPESIEVRERLGRAFEERGLDALAREQFGLVSDLAER